MYKLVYKLEGVLEQKELTMGVFVDIEGAFNSAPVTAMMEALVERGVDCFDG